MPTLLHFITMGEELLYTLGSSGLQYLLNDYSMQRNYNLQFKYAKGIFDYQNAYNTPLQQLNRLRQAGISPWVMNPSTNLATMPQGAAPNNSAPDIASQRVASAQAKQISANAEKTRTETKQMKDLFDYVLAQAACNVEGTNLNNEFLRRSLDTRLELLVNQNLLTADQNEALKQDMMFHSDQYKLILQHMQQQYKQMLKDYDISEEELQNKKHEGKLLEFEEQIKKVSADIADQYGVTPDSDGFKALIQAVISGHGADVLENLVQGIVQTSYRTTKRFIKNPLRYLLGDVDE